MNSKHKIRLLITSGDGPAECRIAVLKVVNRLSYEATAAWLETTLPASNSADKYGPPSIIVEITGATALGFSERWIGTIQWTCQSTVRPNHKRKNWFVGVFSLQDEKKINIGICESDLRFEAFRAGGPGGQHQNKTDSAVRLTHLPTGIVVVSSDQRSQHRNKQMALIKLEGELTDRRRQIAAEERANNSMLNRQLERGSPVRCFVGEKFKEVKTKK